MSLDINWEKLDPSIAESLKEWLNGHFRNIDRPSFIGAIEVRQFDFGSVPPDVIIRDLTDPLPEFYVPDYDDSISNPNTPPERPGGKRNPPVYRDDLGRADTTALIDDSVSVVSGPVLGTPPSPTILPRSTSSNLGVGWGAGLGLNGGKSGHTTPPRISTSVPSTASSSGDVPRSEIDDRVRVRSENSSSIPNSPSLNSFEKTPSRFGQDTVKLAGLHADDLGGNSHSSMQIAADALKGPWDTQLELDLQYSGNMRLEIQTELIIHHPTPGFMTLPIHMTLTGFSLSAVALVSYLGDRICFCFKTPAPKDRFLEDVSIDSEVGDKGRQAVLKNVGKIEKFVVEALRRLLYTELVHPNFLELELVTGDN
ncbi:Mitochondrial distribution and morphology protein 12 [Gonapodya sp. JEL0774]|nr:Mitochondrial distribution and morphology protein 12 [Gonapodya sp. JEL0774]